MKNLDEQTVASFGDEWDRFDQTAMSDSETAQIFNEYFSVFPWDSLPPNAEGFDMGCGSGRWASFVAPRVGRLHCIDPSSAIEVARKRLATHDNVIFHKASVEGRALASASQDFGYSLGVLHHVPDTQAAISSCVDLLKPGAPLLLYLYYAFDNRPYWYRAIWKISDTLRRGICTLPAGPKRLVTDAIACAAYFPLARLARLGERLGLDVHGLPLAYYRSHSFYTMRTDARDRFGTPLEQRFTRDEIRDLMSTSGLERISFSTAAPFWCAVGYKAAT